VQEQANHAGAGDAAGQSSKNSVAKSVCCCIVNYVVLLTNQFKVFDFLLHMNI